MGAQTRERSLHEYPQIKDATSDQQFRGLQETVVIDRDAAARPRHSTASRRQHALQRVRPAAGLDHLHATKSVSRRSRGRSEVPARSELARQDLRQVAILEIRCR